MTGVFDNRSQIFVRDSADFEPSAAAQTREPYPPEPQHPLKQQNAAKLSALLPLHH